MDFRQYLFKYRSYTPIPFLFVMAFAARPVIVSMITGFCLVIVGEFLRLWGVSFVGSETRTTGAVGASQLVMKGPFAFVRNPLYLGNMLIYLGVGIMSNTPVLALVAFIYFLFQYTLIVSLEEETLLKKFGPEYVEYYKEVPRFIPTFKPYPSTINSQIEVDWKKGFASEKRTLQAIALAVSLVVVLWIVRG